MAGARTPKQREPRRHRAAAEKRRLIELTLRPGASLRAIAREHGVHPNSLRQWKALYRTGKLDASARGRRQLIWWVWQARSSYPIRKRRYIPCDNFGDQSPKDRLVAGAFQGFVEIERYRGPRPGDEPVSISTIAANQSATEGQNYDFLSWH